MKSIGARTSAEQIIALERGALDRWGNGDPVVTYQQDAQGAESVGRRRNSTTVFQRRGDTWKTLHSHWSFTRHPAFQNLSPEASERQGA